MPASRSTSSSNVALEVVDSLGESLISALESVKDQAYVHLDSVAVVSQTICGLAAFLYIGTKLWSSWAQGKPIDFYQMLRPFITGLLIVFFSGFTYCLDALVAPIEQTTIYIKESTQEETTNRKNSYQAKYKKMKAIIDTYEKKSADEKGFLDRMSDSAAGFTQMVSNAAVSFSHKLVEIFSTATVYFYKVYVVTAKIILVLLGPFAFALSIIPGFGGNVKSWVAQYINISLYIPVCNIIGYIQTAVYKTSVFERGLTQMESINLDNMNAGTYAALSNVLMRGQVGAIILGIVAIMMYAHVPTFANWVLRGDGSGGAASAIAVGGGLAATQLPGKLKGMSVRKPSSNVTSSQGEGAESKTSPQGKGPVSSTAVNSTSNKPSSNKPSSSTLSSSTLSSSK